MTEHTKTDGLPGMDTPTVPQVLERARPRNERMAADKIECNACPVLCQISAGQDRRLRPLRQPRAARWCASIRWCCCAARWRPATRPWCRSWTGPR